MNRSSVREALVLLTLSLLLGLSYNAIVGRGIFGPTEAAAAPAISGSDLPAADIIPIDRARELFDARAALFVDTRHAYDYDLDHIPGAINVPLKEAQDRVRALDIPKDRTLVIYCDGAECNSSFEVSSVFIMEGYTDIRIFFAGWQAWKQMGYETEETSR